MIKYILRYTQLNCFFCRLCSSVFGNDVVVGFMDIFKFCISISFADKRAKLSLIKKLSFGIVITVGWIQFCQKISLILSTHNHLKVFFYTSITGFLTLFLIVL